MLEFKGPRTGAGTARAVGTVRPSGRPVAPDGRGNCALRQGPKYMTDSGKTRAQQLLGDTAPELVRLTDEVLFGQVWADPGLPSGTAA